MRMSRSSYRTADNSIPKTSRGGFQTRPYNAKSVDRQLDYLSGFTNCPSPGLPTILPSSITVFPRTIVRTGTPFTFLSWYGVQPTLVYVVSLLITSSLFISTITISASEPGNSTPFFGYTLKIFAALYEEIRTKVSRDNLPSLTALRNSRR